MKKLIVIQSRMDSDRLPGKAALEIKGKPTLQHVIERCKKSGERVVVATTDREVDDPIEAICLVTKVPCYRYMGDRNDVLGRFYWVAMKENFRAGGNKICRVTADCLGVDATTINETFDACKDYAYANPEQGYPQGHGCEVFSWRALREAHERATSAYDREHVTPYIQRSFHWDKPRANRYDDFNLELNTEEDYARIVNIYQNVWN